MKRLLRGLLGRGDTLRQLFAFLWQERLWWMIPMLLVLLLLSVLLLFTQSSAVAPFIYTLF